VSQSTCKAQIDALTNTSAMYMGFNMFYLEPNEHRYLTPREQYDRAIINDAGERCIYDEKQVLSILTKDYRQTVDQQLKRASEEAKQYVARKQALQFMRFLQLGCYYYHGPLIKNLSTHIEI
jgi:hypothetical protein